MLRQNEILRQPRECKYTFRKFLQSGGQNQLFQRFAVPECIGADLCDGIRNDKLLQIFTLNKCTPADLFQSLRQNDPLQLMMIEEAVSADLCDGLAADRRRFLIARRYEISFLLDYSLIMCYNV